MARSRRLFIPGVAQHVVQRGNNRGDMFRCAEDHEVFLYMLLDALLKYPVQVHAYVLMRNHVHFMVTPEDPHALPRTMQSIGRRYVPYFNKKYERTGSLFEGRYRSAFVDDERYWFTCMRYIELNPVRAGLVSKPGEYRWSSYHRHASGESDLIVAPHPLYMALGATSSDRERSWRGICGLALPEDDLRDMRTAIHQGRMPHRVIFPDTAGV